MTYLIQGRYVDRVGYVRVKVPGHCHATTNGWGLEHRIVMAEALGRKLARHEVVHHKDGNVSNNRLENLEMMSVGQHTRLHSGNKYNRREDEDNPEISCACGCEKILEKYDSRGRSRRYIRGHNRTHGGGGPSGEGASTAKLSDEKVLYIRHQWQLGKYSQSELARHFGVDNSTISLIVNRKTWNHI